MVQKNVLKKIGVFAVTVILAAAPIMAVNAEAASQMARAAGGSEDPVTSDPKPVNPNPIVVTPAGTSSCASSVEEDDFSNYTVTTASGQVLVSTLPGTYRVSNVPGFAITTPSSELPGGTTVSVSNSQRGSKAAQSIQDGLAILAQSGVNATKGSEIDLSIFINGADTTDLDRKFTVSIGIPSDFKQAGYDYAVMLVQVGGRVSILPSSSADPNVITISTSGAGVYCIVKAPAGSFNKFQ